MDDLAKYALLQPEDPPVFDVVNGHSNARVVLLCDHGGREVPRRLDRLGLEEKIMERHIAWDIGAEALTRDLAAKMGWTAIIAGYSRLVIDPNRQLDDPTSIPEHSDGVSISGNIGLSEDARRSRVREIFHPYHMAVQQAIERHTDHNTAPAILSLHTFTPEFAGVTRPWEAGVLWIDDARLPSLLLDALKGEPGLTVGDNEPYSARLGLGYTTSRHADAHGLANATLELRQDQVNTPSGIADWSARLTQIFAEVFADESLYEIYRRDPINKQV